MFRCSVEDRSIVRESKVACRQGVHLGLRLSSAALHGSPSEIECHCKYSESGATVHEKELVEFA